MVVGRSDGRFLSSWRDYATMVVQCVAVGSGSHWISVHGDSTTSLKAGARPELCDAIATEAARVATVQLSALKFRSGIMPVVIGAGAGAMLLHEAIGHGLEGDFAALGRSVYAKSIGRRIAPSNVSVIDDPTIPASVVPINSMTKVKMREQHR